jgi:DNA-binding transcriptional MerR regulator
MSGVHHRGLREARPVSVRMLRHYDAIGLLRPAHVDPATFS